MNEEQLFLFQVTVHNIVITDKSCLTGRKDGGITPAPRICVQIKYPELNWIELDQLDFLSFQGKQSSAQEDNSDDSAASMIKLTSNQVFYPRQNIICNEGKSNLISMEPDQLCSHFMENKIQIVLYESVLIDGPSWIIATSQINIGNEMSQLVIESLKHPGLEAAPAEMDKQFTLQNAHGKVSGNLQCTIFVLSAGKTSEFARVNSLCMNGHSEGIEGSESDLCESILDVEDSTQTIFDPSRDVTFDSSSKGKISRLISAGNANVFSYFKGELSKTRIDRNESFIVGPPKLDSPLSKAFNHNKSIDYIPKSSPTRTDITEVSSAVFDERSSDTFLDQLEFDEDETDDDSLSNSSTVTSVAINPQLSTPDLSKILGKVRTNNMAAAREKSNDLATKRERGLSLIAHSYSTLPNMPHSKIKSKAKKLQKTAKLITQNETASRPKTRIRNERQKIKSESTTLHRSTSPVKFSKVKTPAVNQKTPVTIKKAKGLAFEENRPSPVENDKNQSLSIVKQNSEYHVAIKNSRNQLDKILKFKLCGNKTEKKRKESFNITVINT